MGRVERLKWQNGGQSLEMDGPIAHLIPKGVFSKCHKFPKGNSLKVLWASRQEKTRKMQTPE